MEVLEIITCAIGSGGIIGGGYSLYTAKLQKRRIAVEITQLLNDEWESLFNKLKKDTNDKIDSLEKKVYKFELKDKIKTKAINQFIKCPFVREGHDCPISVFIESADETLQMKLNPEQIALLNGKVI